MQFLREIVFKIKKYFTYYHLLVLLGICCILLVFFCGLNLRKVLHKKQTFSLNLSPDTIPFLIIEDDVQNKQYQSIYLGFWDLVNAKLYRDDTLPVCDIEGELGQAYWIGNKQLILSPTSNRGNLLIRNLDPQFIIQVKTGFDYSQTLIKPSFDSQKTYYLSIDQDSGTLEFSDLLDKNFKPIKVLEIPMNPYVRLVKPISIIPDNVNPRIYCFFENKIQPEKGLGILEGKLVNRKIEWVIWKNNDETLTKESIGYCNYSLNAVLISDSRQINLFSLSQNDQKQNLASANNYFTMFRQYLFGNTGSNGFINRQGFDLVEESVSPPSIQIYKNLQFLVWNPHFTSQKEFYAKQVIAIDKTKIRGRIEVLGDKIRIFKDSILVSEESANSRFISSRWIFPDE